MVKRKDIRTFVIILLLVLMEQVFYLINDDVLKIGSITYDIIILIPAVLYFYYLMFCKMPRQRIKYHFKHEICLLLLFVLVAAWRCNLLTGQAFSKGLLPQRDFFLVLLLYFPIRKLYYGHKIDDSKLVKMLEVAGVISIGIFLLQVLVVNQYHFLNVTFSERYGTARLYVDSVLAVVISFLGIDLFFKTKKVRYIYLIVLCLLYEFFVSKGRLELLALIVSLLIGVIIMKRYKGTKMVLLIASLVLVFVLFSSSYGENFLEAFHTLETGTLTMRTRTLARENFVVQLSRSIPNLFLGCGYPNALWEPARIMAGYSQGANLVDNGIFAFTYVYGISGLLIVIMLFTKLLRYSMRIYKTGRDYSMLMLTVFFILLMYNITFWWWRYSWTFMLIIMMCRIENMLFDDTQTCE